MTLGLWQTLTGLALCVLLGLLARWRDGLPPDPTRVRLVPWTTILLAAVVAGLLLLVHLANLAGFETGQGRR